MKVANSKKKTGEYTQVYSYKNKEEIFITITVFVSATGQVSMVHIITMFFH